MDITITKKMYGWSKYGGARHGLVKEKLPEWTCQLCGSIHTSELPSYFMEETSDKREFYRICSVCKHKAIKLEIDNFTELLNLKVANLLTLPAEYKL